MAYPDSFDTISDPGSTLVGHAAIHDNLDGAITRVQTELGLNPSGDESTVAGRIAELEDGAASGVTNGSVKQPKLDQAKIWDPLHHGWESYTPGTDNIDKGANGTITGRYQRVGSLVNFWIKLTLKTGAEFTATPARISLPPVPPIHILSAAAFALEGAVTYHVLTATNVDFANKLQFITQDVGGAGAGLMGKVGGVSTPFTPGALADDILVVSGSYQCSQPEADTLA